MLDCVDYSIDSNNHQGNGNNGYDRLDGEWLTYYKVGKGFTHKVKPEDREDFLHDLFLAFARVKDRYDTIGKPLTEGGLVRIAGYEVATYWRRQFKEANGIDCGSCSKAQRQECKKRGLYHKCPKAIKIDSLDSIIEDGNGDNTPLHEFIADDKAVDIAAMLDARHTLNGYPRRFIQLAYKRYAGYPLDKKERNYFNHKAKKLQKAL
jgi:hypothetical protein